MSASSTLRRTLLATSTPRLFKPISTHAFNSSNRLPRAIANTTTINTTNFYRPFSATANMGQGIHNIRNKQEWDSAVSAEKGKLMVVDCFATWCGPCKIIAPKVSGFADTYTDATFYKMDVDEVPDVAQEQSIRAMPTFLLFKDGERIADVVGANPVALEAAIKQHL